MKSKELQKDLEQRRGKEKKKGETKVKVQTANIWPELTQGGGSSGSKRKKDDEPSPQGELEMQQKKDRREACALTFLLYTAIPATNTAKCPSLLFLHLLLATSKRGG